MTAKLFAGTLAVYVAGEILAHLLGISFDDSALGALYQYLDPEILHGDLARGLFYLHAQPPLFNLFLGAVMKIFPESSTAAFSVCFGLAAFGLLLGTVWLLRWAGVSGPLALVLAALFAWHPNFLVYRHWLFYTLPVAFALVFLGVVLARWAETGRAREAHLFSWGAAALMLTRAVYHPLWLLAVLAGAAFLVEKNRRRTLLVSAIAPLLLVGAVYLKNHSLAGHFSGSSWIGLSLAKRWPLSQSETASLRAEGKIPPFWHRRPFMPPHELRRFGYFRGDGSAADHPALAAPYKSNGEPNFNHRDYGAISTELFRGNLHLIASFPDRYLQRTLTALLLYLQPGPNSVHFLVDYDFARVHRVRDFITRSLFLGGRIERPIRMLEPPLNLWVVGFPLLLGYGAWRSFRGTRAERVLFTFITVTAVWVTLVSNLVEIGENDRLRWEIEPLLLVLLGSAISAAAGRAAARRGSRGPDAAGREDRERSARRREG